MADDKCKYGMCDGSGFIRTDENTESACKCWREKQTLLKLTTDLRTARPIKGTPLYSVVWEDGQNVIQTDKTAENMLLKGTWNDVLSHIRVAMIGKLCDTGWLFRYTFESDKHLLDVWLSKESYKNRPTKQREDVATYNTLKDAVGPDFDLVIIQLGALKHKNIAAANVILEALVLRETSHKPTWFVETPDCPFDPALPVYSEALHRYIYTHFETLTCSVGEPKEAKAVPPPVRRTVEAPRAHEAPTEDVSLDDIVNVPGLTDHKGGGGRRGGGYYQ